MRNVDVTGIRPDSKYGVFRWRRQIRLDDGTPVRLTGTSPNKTEARRDMDRAVRKALSESRAPKPVKASPLFSAFAETWLATFPPSKNNRKTTIASKTYHVRKRLIPYFGEAARLTDITGYRISRMVADMSAGGRLDGGAKPISVKTVSHVVQTLRRLLRSAVTWGELAALPEFPSIKVPKAPFDYLTFAEASAVLSATKEKAGGAYTLLLTAMRTGPRAGELLGLTWDRIDYATGRIRYDRQLAPGYRSGGEPKFVEVKSGPRSVPMTIELGVALRNLHAAKTPGPSDFVFTGPTSGRPFTRAYLKVIVEGALELAGVRRLHPHALRHTFASHCAMKGVPIQQIQQWLGHSSIMMTMRYAHLWQSNAADDLIRVLDS